MIRLKGAEEIFALWNNYKDRRQHLFVSNAKGSLWYHQAYFLN